MRNCPQRSVQKSKGMKWQSQVSARSLEVAAAAAAAAVAAAVVVVVAAVVVVAVVVAAQAGHAEGTKAKSQSDVRL